VPGCFLPAFDQVIEVMPDGEQFVLYPVFGDALLLTVLDEAHPIRIPDVFN
jgi:hypothetical protein